MSLWACWQERRLRIISIRSFMACNTFSQSSFTSQRMAVKTPDRLDLPILINPQNLALIKPVWKNLIFIFYHLLSIEKRDAPGPIHTLRMFQPGQYYAKQVYSLIESREIRMIRHLLTEKNNIA